MPSFRQVALLINVETGKEVDRNTLSDREGLSLNMVYGELLIFNITFVQLVYNEDGSKQTIAWPLPSGAVFSVFGDVDFIDRTAFMFQSNTTLDDTNPINRPGDWGNGSTANPGLGQMSARVNTTTPRFKDVLNEGRIKGGCHFCITMTPASQTTGSIASSVLALTTFSAENRPVQAVSGPPATDPMPKYYTAAEVNSLLRSAYKFRFSSDGINWHETQSPVDIFYQQSILDGAWSDPMKLLYGVAGSVTQRTKIAVPVQAEYTLKLDPLIRVYDVGFSGACKLKFDYSALEALLPRNKFASTWEVHVYLNSQAALNAITFDPEIIWLGALPDFNAMSLCYNVVFRREVLYNDAQYRTYASSAYEVLL